MDKKLIFFDIDGTLITEGVNHYVPDSTRKALRELRNNGHICIINTGRPYSALDDVIKSIETDGYICGCGTYINFNDRVLLANHIDKKLCREIAYDLDKCRLEWLLEGENDLYYSENEYKSIIFRDIKSLRTKLPDITHCITRSDYDSINYDKFCFVKNPDSDFESFYDKYKGLFTFIDRGSNFYEVVPAGFSKATGMRFLEDCLDISNDDTIAVGDSTNDITMFEYANTSIVMGNADKALYSYADYVTTAVDNDGIYNAFRHLKLI